MGKGMEREEEGRMLGEGGMRGGAAGDAKGGSGRWKGGESGGMRG